MNLNYVLVVSAMKNWRLQIKNLNYEKKLK